jgi:hypothetical protein
MKLRRRRLVLAGTLIFAFGMLAGSVGGTFAAFSGTTANGPNSFSAASSFCSGSTSTVNADADTYVKEDGATTNFGTDTTMTVKPDATKHRRGLIHFALPTIPQYCVVTSATLTLNATAVAAGHSINIARAGASWTENAVTWNTQPGSAGTPVSAAVAVGNMTWTVTSFVKGMYSGSDYGFTIRDANDAAGSPNGQTTFVSREGASNTPQLSVTFGSGSSADTVAPLAMDVQTTNVGGGTNGKPEVGDTITYTFSEAMSPSSILSGWNGTSTNVVVRMNNNASDDIFQVWNSANSTQTNIGQINSGGNYSGSNITFGLTGTASTMVMSSNSVTVTLGTASAGPATGAIASMTWTPSSSATDTAGNACDTAAGEESGVLDKDF